MKKSTKIIAVLSIVLVICLGVGGVGLFKLYQSNATYLNYLRITQHIERTQKTSTENASKLYSAILENKSITDKEKKELANYIQYFVDNKYIDCEHVCNKLSAFTITPNDPSLLDEGIGAEYRSENTITFANNDERESALSHEIHHCIESEALSYEEYGWFGEGFTCLVNYEYFDKEDESYNTQTFFVRGLCELVGADVLFKLSATGDPVVLENALIDCGIDKTTIAQAFELFTELKNTESYGGVATAEERFEAVNILLDMYNVTYDNPGNVTYSFYKAVEQYMGVSCEECCYYLNSTKRSSSDWKEQYVPQTDLTTLYNTSCGTVY